MREGLETMKGFQGRDRGHVFDVCFSHRNQSFSLAALWVTIIGRIEVTAEARVRVKLYGGKIIEAKITAIVNQSTGRKIRISFGKESVPINPEQIIEVLDSPLGFS
jgi:hypothetical protein